jgi:hypothetical protein
VNGRWNGGRADERVLQIADAGPELFGKLSISVKAITQSSNVCRVGFSIELLSKIPNLIVKGLDG